MYDLEYHSAHAQMTWSQWFRNSEISLDTGFRTFKLSGQ